MGYYDDIGLGKAESMGGDIGSTLATRVLLLMIKPKT